MPFPTYDVRVDWDSNGFGSSGIDVITGDVLRMRLVEGIDGFGSNGEEQSLVITVDNNDGKYHDLNSSSALFGKLKPLRQIHVNATWAGTTVGIFEGFVDAIAPEGFEGDRTATLTCSGIIPRLAHILAASLSQDDYAPRDVRTALVGYAPVAIVLSGDYSEVAPISAAAFDADNLSGLRRLNEMTLSRHFIRPTNAFTGTRANYHSIGRNDGISSAVTDSWTKGTDFERVIEWSGPAGALVNRQRAYGELHHEGGLVEVWRWPGGNIVLGPDEIWETQETLGATVRDAECRVIVSSGSASTLSPLLYDKGQALFGVQAGISGAVITDLWLVARPDRLTDITAESEDTASQAIYGLVLGEYISSDLIRSAATAKGLTDHVVWRNATPRRRVKLLHENRFDANVALRRWPGDTIAITEPEFGLSSFRAQIIQRETVIDTAGESWIETTLLEEMPPAVTPFVVGSSAIGGAHILAR